MFVVKIRNYYIRDVDYIKSGNAFYVREIIISKELMRSFDRETAEALANEIKGEAVEMVDQDTVDEKQLTIFDKEVQSNE